MNELSSWQFVGLSSMGDARWLSDKVRELSNCKFEFVVEMTVLQCLPAARDKMLCTRVRAGGGR